MLYKGAGKPRVSGLGRSPAIVTNGCQKQQAVLIEKSRDRPDGKDEFFARKAKFRAQLDELGSKIDTLMVSEAETNVVAVATEMEGSNPQVSSGSPRPLTPST